MTAAASGRRRGLWPVLLISTALVGLALGAIAVGQLYWSSMHDSMERMRASIAETRTRHQALLRELQAARAALAAQGAQSAPPASPRADDPGKPLPTEGPAAQASPASLLLKMPDGGPAPLLALIDGLRHEVARLGPGARDRSLAGRWRPGRGSGSSAAPGPLLKDQLRLAEVAVNRGDVVLLDHAAGASQRLLLDFYGAGDARAAALLQRLDTLRGALRSPAGRAR